MSRGIRVAAATAHRTLDRAADRCQLRVFRCAVRDGAFAQKNVAKFMNKREHFTALAVILAVDDQHRQLTVGDREAPHLLEVDAPVRPADDEDENVVSSSRRRQNSKAFPCRAARFCASLSTFRNSRMARPTASGLSRVVAVSGNRSGLLSSS